ncbi:MAG TPA: asparagine synthase (glutamine-hydrolyzing) [Nitrososphaera sp.]
MCGIGGIISKSGDDVVPLVGMMLSRMAKRGPDGAGVATEKSIVRSPTVQGLDLENVKGSRVLGHARLAIVGGTCGSQPFRSCDGRLTLEHNGEIYNYKKLKAELGEHNFSTQTDSEVIVHMLEERLKAGAEFVDAIKEVVSELDGIYALAIRDEKTGVVALVRDRLGVRPLYYGENDRFVAFASERKGLWEVGIREPTMRVMPGHAILISPEGQVSKVKVADVPTPRKPAYKTMKSAVAAYEKAFLASMQKRTEDVDRIGIVFSGGIDSVLVAHAARKMAPEVVCYTAGMEGSHDTEYARTIADALSLELHVKELTQDDVERLIPEIVDVIEDNNAGQVEVALPVYCAVQLASRQGMRIMLTGQAADELFGGYSWYSNVAEKQGYRKLREYMREDLMLLYKETLEREDKISMAHSVEMREPFLDLGVIETSMDIDMRLNVRKNDRFGKWVHRRLAQKLGIPRGIAFRIKEAAQHGSGVHSAIDAIARKHGFDESAVTSGYLKILESHERVGSSQRYGYLFEKEQKMWIAEPHVQMYLDSLVKTPVLAKKT